MTLATAPRFQSRRHTLRDGSEVTVRSVREDDADKLQATIRALSDESRYLRFFSPLRELSANQLERAVHPDAGTELQLVAVCGVEPGHVIAGGARFVGTAADTCEFAITIAQDWQGRGLARVLMETLIQAARDRGFAHMEGHVLSSNAAMLGLAARLGFDRLASDEGPTVSLVRLAL